MRRASTWILVGTLAFAAVGWAESPDDEPAVVEADQAFQAAGAHVWVGRMPSQAELRVAVSEVRSRMRRARADATGPDFQDERVQVYVGRMPGLEELRGEARRSSGR